MAKANSTQSQETHKDGTSGHDSPCYGGVTPGLYKISDEATTPDISSQLHARVSQLHAMLTAIGPGGANLDEMDEDTRANYLWGCQTLAQECSDLSNKLW